MTPVALTIVSPQREVATAFASCFHSRIIAPNLKWPKDVKRTRDTNSPSKDGSRGVRSGISRHSRSSGSFLIELSRGSCFAMRNIRLRQFCFFRNENPRAAFVYNPTAVSRRNASDCLETHEATLCGSCRSCWFMTIHAIVLSIATEDRDGVDREIVRREVETLLKLSSSHEEPRSRSGIKKQRTEKHLGTSRRVDTMIFS